MKYFVSIILLCTIHFNVNGQSFEFTPKSVQKGYYAWLTSLTEGPIDWMDKPSKGVHGKAQRICITNSEIYTNFYIEQVTYGNEGCCKAIAKSRELDLYKVFEKFGLQGEISNVKFHQWIDKRSCEIIIKEKVYRLINIDNKRITIELKN